VGVFLAGVVTCGWVIVGIVEVAGLATRTVQRWLGQRPRPHPERGNTFFAAFVVTLTAMPLLLLGGWEALSLSVIALGLTSIAPVALEKMNEGWVPVDDRPESWKAMWRREWALRVGAFWTFLLTGPILGVAFAWHVTWRRLLEAGSTGRALAFCMSALTVMLVVSLFGVCVWEAVTRLGAWSRRRTRPSWLVLTGIGGAIVVLVNVVSESTRMPWWYVVPGLMMATIAAGLYLLREAEGGEGNFLMLLDYIIIGATGFWFLRGVLLGPKIAASCPPRPDTGLHVVVLERGSCVLKLLTVSLQR